VKRHDSQTLLSVEHVSKVYRGPDGDLHQAVDNVTFTLAAGESLAVVGESGSGKSTIARIVAGLVQPTSGTVSLDGGPVADTKTRRAGARQVQMVFQDPFGSLDPRQRIGSGLRELLAWHFGLRGASADERVTALLHHVGLDDKHGSSYPRELSGGQCQRVAIARALAVDPAIVILDEAVSALDVSVQAQVLNLLEDIRRDTGVAYLFVSHDLGVVRQVTDECIVLHRGRIVEQGPTADVLDNPLEDYTRALIDSVPKPGWKPRRRTVGNDTTLGAVHGT
jgi:ABC-type glutathione transport system ATPase component